MAQLLLTSNGFYTDEIKEAFLSIIDSSNKELRAVIIPTASPQKANNRFAQLAKQDMLSMGIAEVDFLDIELEDPARLSEYNIIYLSGGNPIYLLHHLRVSGAGDVLKSLAKRDDLAIVGASAGALVLGLTIAVVPAFTPHMNTVGMQDFVALGLSKHALFPHYDREDVFPDEQGRTIEERLNQFEQQHHIAITRLKDADYVLERTI